MPTKFSDLMKMLRTAKKDIPLSAPDVGHDEGDDLFEQLHGCFVHRTWPPGRGGLRLTITAGDSLSPQDGATCQQIIDGFNERLKAGEIRLARGPNGRLMPAPAEGERIENEGMTNPCQWYWKLKYYWWGVRLGLNHCAVNWLSDTATVGAAISAFGLPPWIGMILRAIAMTLKVFDRGCGVRVYITWGGVSWLTPRPTSVKHC